MNLETLALAVDELVRVPAGDRSTARLYGVRVEGADGADVRVRLELLANGEARQLPQKVTPSGDLFAVALAATAWAAPMDGEWAMRTRPSLHPQRQRVHTTVLVADEDGEEVSVLRHGDDEPWLLRGGVGVVHERLLQCWARRQGAPAGDALRR
jgi:hypothetical protein